MPDLYSRRSFIAGVLTAGVVSTSASFLLTRRESVTLTLATGSEPTGGGRELLTTLWNQQHPDVRIAVNEINSSTQDQFAKFTERPADIYNLDVIHIPRFAAAGRIVPIAPQNDISLLTPVRQVVRIPGENERLWAVPYNTDVGMLYRRVTDKRAADPEPDLRDVLAGGSFAGQLDTVGVATDEAFVVNVLEHALAQDDSILAPDGVVSFSLGQWRTALAPLAEALRRRRLWDEAGEADTNRAFQSNDLTYMRNWPVWFPGIDRAERAEPGTAEIRLGRLPAGILGGQCLAVSSESEHPEEAARVIHFLTDTPAQKLLATFGFAPTGLDAYIDAGLQNAAPQLAMVRNAVEAARPRPPQPGYAAFAQRFKEHTYAYLHRGEQLTQRFVRDLQEALQ